MEVTKWPDGVWPPVQEAGSARLDAQGGEARPPRGPPKAAGVLPPQAGPIRCPSASAASPPRSAHLPQGSCFFFPFLILRIEYLREKKEKKQTGSSYFLPLPSRLDKNAK